MSLAYDDAAEPKWKLLEGGAVRRTNRGSGKLAADEELNTANLDEMKTALDDLKIVDVCRKPAGFSADLKANAELPRQRRGPRVAGPRGFYPAEVDGQQEFLSNQGEIRFLMKDGVEYVLRFGATSSAPREGTAKKGGEESKANWT